MQNYIEIDPDKTLALSLADLLNNDKTALSQSSGTAFPTANLQVGMPCFRTDQNKLYVLKDLTPTWVLALDLSAAALINRATNLAAGVAGAIPWQSAADTTSFLAPGAAGYVLTSGGDGTPVWVSQASIAPSLTWGAISGKPTTLASFGFTDLGTVTVGNATTAATANALNTANDYQAKNLSVGGVKNAGWGATVPVIDFPNGSIYNFSTYLQFGMNSYHDGTNYRAKVTGVGGLMAINPDGASAWYKAPSVAAGAVQTFTTLMSLSNTGVLNALGDVSMTSDETLKDEWEGLAKDFLEQLLANVLHGTYHRKDLDIRQAGCGAQGMQRVFPEVVGKGADGLLNIAYGNAAMVTCMVLAERLVALEKRFAELEV